MAEFAKPSAVEALFNRVMGELMEFGGKQILGAAWADAVGAECGASWADYLEAGSTRLRFELREIADEGKGVLGRYASAVGKFFPVKADAPVGAFRRIAGNYPVFESVER
jgi:hypothetical protein